MWDKLDATSLHLFELTLTVLTFFVNQSPLCVVPVGVVHNEIFHNIYNLCLNTILHPHPLDLHHKTGSDDLLVLAILVLMNVLMFRRVFI